MGNGENRYSAKKKKRKAREMGGDMHFTHTRCVFVRGLRQFEWCTSGTTSASARKDPGPELPGGEEHELDARLVG